LHHIFGTLLKSEKDRYCARDDAIFTVDRCNRNMEAKEISCILLCKSGKLFDRVDRDVTRWALRKAGVEEWLV